MYFEGMSKELSINGEQFTVLYVDSDNKNAIARVLGRTITIKLPRKWPQRERKRVAERLEGRILRRIERRGTKMRAIPHNLGEEKLREAALNAKPEVVGRIYQLNARHFSSPLGKVRLKKNITNWGSCSKDNGININIALLFLPKELLDYVIVHELAHTKIRNHSKDFWKLVESALSDYKQRRKELRKYSLESRTTIS